MEMTFINVLLVGGYLTGVISLGIFSLNEEQKDFEKRISNEKKEK